MITLKDYLTQMRSEGIRSFTIQKAAQDLGITENNARAKCKRLKDKGELLSPVRGLYVIIPPEDHKMGSPPPEELIPLVMAYWGIKYYVCLLSAALYHGASHQKSQVFQVMLERREGEMRAGKIRIQFVYKKSLEGLPLQQVTAKTGYLTLATPELTVVDLLLYPHLCGGLNHIATILTELIEAVDPDKLIDLATHTKQKVWVQRLGYILEQIDSYNEEAKARVLTKLEAFIKDKALSYIPLTPEIPIQGYSRDRKWKIIANTTIEADE